MAATLREVYFLPPLAIARLGGSDMPLESFHWVADPSIHGGGRTVIRPAISFFVLPDGSLSPYVPAQIRFSDAGKLRPVAPFFELWASLAGTAPEESEKPLTLALLEALGLAPEDIRFRITVANKKAQRRAQHPSCGFMAWMDVQGCDHSPRELRANSPMDPDHPPLVLRDQPISLGHFQVIRPVDQQFSAADGTQADLSVLRVRFTPGKGAVYGPPGAVASIASPLPEGEALAWPMVMQGRMWDIVAPENRILNPDSLWCRYINSDVGFDGQTNSEPPDSYDGAKVGVERSFGVVDDSCDGVIEAHLVVKGRRYSAQARVTAGPPDYAPDRRHFVSAADDLADRDKAKVNVPHRRQMPRAQAADEALLRSTEREVIDLLVRVFETAGQINLDAERFKFLGNQDSGVLPLVAALDVPAPNVGFASMTADDAPYADLAVDLIGGAAARAAGYPSGAAAAAVPTGLLAFTDMARSAHAKLAEPHHLLEFLRSRAEHVRRLIRPPYGHFADLAENPAPDSLPLANAASAFRPDFPHRDPRVDRDRMHDMRMPPYMRDSDDSPLSLTWRQYRALMEFLDTLSPPEGAAA